MSFDNPYDQRTQQPQKPQGSWGGGGGGGFKPGQPKEPLTPEQLKRLRLPVSVVVTGNDRIPDGDAMTVDRFVKMIDAKGITIRGGTNSDTDQLVTKTVRYVEQHAPWANKGDNGSRFFENKNDGSRVEIKGAGSSFNTDECFEFAARYFVGDFEAANKFQRANHAKTPRLLFGKNLKNPTQLVLIWSEDGVDTPSAVSSRTGWAGHVIKMASAAGIPVINIKNPNAESRLTTFLETIYVKQPPATTEIPAASAGQRSAAATTKSSGFGTDGLDDIGY